MRRRDAIGLGLVALTAAGLELFRAIWFEPRAIGLACLHGTANATLCQARSALGLLTHYQIMGGGALLLGICSIAGAPYPIIVAATCLGIAGVIDYNVTFGMLGAALGAWAWLRAADAGQPT